MAKKLSKILWHDTKVDGAGKPVLPSVATDDKGLNGLLPGELFMHVGKEKVSLWALSLSGEVVEVSGKTDEVDIDFSDYLLKSVWDSVFEIKTDVSGQKYLFGKLPMVTQYGVTMYGDNDELNVSDIYEGLPIDNVTLYWDNGVLKAKGGEGGGGGVADSIAWANVYGKPSWVTDTKPIYNYSEINGTPDLSVFVTGIALSNTLADYATLTYLTGELKKYVTIKDDQDIVGVKNFLNGIKISNMPIRKLQDDVIYIDANLVVRGGVTMYSDNEVDIPSIKDEIGFAGYNGSVGLASFDSSQFVISANGTVSVKGGSTGLDTAQLKEYLDSNKYTTETWVKAQGYASASSLSSLQTKVDNFLEGSDTDTIINKWKELEAFLSGLSESDNLATILSTKWTTDNNLINQWNTAYGWGDHSKVGYALKSYVDNNFVTLGTQQTITGEKNFTGGLKVNGSPIYYDATNKYWKLEGDLLVTGGVTMYGTDEGDLPSILDSLPIASTSSAGIASFDSTYFSVNASGKVTLTSAPSSVSILGNLQDVSSSVSGTTNSDVVLFKSANTSTWTTKLLSEIGGGGSIQRPLRWTGYDSGTWDGTSDGLIVIPTSLKNPNAITFTGAVSATYDGSSAVTVKIPTVDLSGYLPLSGGIIESTEEAPLVIRNSYKTSSNGGSIKILLQSSVKGTTGDVTNAQIGYTINSGLYLFNYYNYNNLICAIGVDNDGKPFVGKGGTLSTKYEILHEGNYSSYALPKDGNAVSATKLQTTRSIWGQSFNGTASISGNLTMDNNASILQKDASGNAIEAMRTSANGNLTIGYGFMTGGKRTYVSGSCIYIRCGSSKIALFGSDNGYVGIGMDSPQYPLDVYGKVHTSSDVIAGGAIYTYDKTNTTDGKEGVVITKGYINIVRNADVPAIQFYHNTTTPVQKILGLADYIKFSGKTWHSDVSYFGNSADYYISAAGSVVCNGLLLKGTLRSSIIPDEHDTYTLGTYTAGMAEVHSNVVTSGSNSNNLWLIGGTSSGNYGVVIARNSTGISTGEICRFHNFGMYWASGVVGRISTRDTELQLMYADDSTKSLLLNSEAFTPFNVASGNIKLGRYTALWNGVYVGVDTGTALNTRGIVYCNSSNQTTALVSQNGGTGAFVIYSTGTVVFRPSCSAGTNGGVVGNSGKGVEISSSGLLCTGGITMYSDIRKKTKLQDVELSLSQIANAPLIEHYYNSDDSKTTHVGSIAQYWARLNDWFCKLDAEGFYTMEIQNCALASAISIARHLEKYESKTDKKIRMLKKRVQELEDKLERLEGGNYGCR